MLAFIFVNKVLLKHSHAPVLTQHCNSFCPATAKLNSHNRETKIHQTFGRLTFKKNITFPAVVWYMNTSSHRDCVWLSPQCLMWLSPHWLMPCRTPINIGGINGQICHAIRPLLPSRGKVVTSYSFLLLSCALCSKSWQERMLQTSWHLCLPLKRNWTYR